MTIREKNLLVLEQRFPGISDLLPAQANGPWEFLTSPQGAVTVRYASKALHSLYDPLKEAQRVLPASANVDYAIALGLGLGYTIEAFLKVSGDLPILIAEPDASFFSAVLDQRDLTQLWADPRVSVLLGDNPQGVGKFQELFISHNYQILELRPYREFHQPFFQRLENELSTGALHRGVNLRTWDKFAPLWLKNWLRNLGSLTLARPLNQLQNTARGLRVLIAAAGPSLETCLPYMARNRDKFILIAVDTAFRRLQNMGLEPDFLVFMDGQYWNSRHVDMAPPKRTRVVCELSSHPRALRCAPGRTFIQSGTNPLAQGLESQLPNLGSLKSGGSVATTAWELAKFIGAQEVFFAGLDLGYPQGETHVKGSLFEERVHWLSYRLAPSEGSTRQDLRSTGLEKRPSNNGSWVYTDARMEIYRQWFEVSLLDTSRPKAINLSPTGVAIRGMETQSPNVLDNLENQKTLPEIPSTPILSAPELKDFMIKLFKSLTRLSKNSDHSTPEELLEAFEKEGLGIWTRAFLAPALKTQVLFPGTRSEDRSRRAANSLVKQLKSLLKNESLKSF